MQALVVVVSGVLRSSVTGLVKVEELAVPEEPVCEADEQEAVVNTKDPSKVDPPPVSLSVVYPSSPPVGVISPSTVVIV